MKIRKLVPLVALVLALGVTPASARTKKTNSGQGNSISSLFSKISSSLGAKRTSRKGGSTGGTKKKKGH